MSSKKPKSIPIPKAPPLPRGQWASALEAYIKHPERHEDLVLAFNDRFVLIRDKFPKAKVHCLLLPRDLERSRLHPFVALADQALFKEVEAALDEFSEILVDLLKAAYKSRVRIPLESDDHLKHGDEGNKSDDEIAATRSMPQFKIGVHAIPSMSNLHIHIISPDMCGPALKKREHYQSFNTQFFVPLCDLPLDDEDWRRGEAAMASEIKKNFKCSRCQTTFGNSFKAIKAHLPGCWGFE